MSQWLALISECGSQKSWKVLLTSIHRFDETKHTCLQAYKFDLDGDVLFGTINFIADSAAEMDDVLNSSKRQRKPPERYIVLPSDSTEIETDDEAQTNRGRTKRKAEDDKEYSLQLRLAELKKKQLAKKIYKEPVKNVPREASLDISSSSEMPPNFTDVHKKNNLEIRNEIPVRQLESSKSEAARPPQEKNIVHKKSLNEIPIKEVGISKPEISKRLQQNKINDKKFFQSKVINSKTLPMNGKVLMKSVEGETLRLSILSTTHNSFMQAVVQRSQKNVTKAQVRSLSLTTSLELCRKRLQTVEKQNEALRNELKARKLASLESTEKLNAAMTN